MFLIAVEQEWEPAFEAADFTICLIRRVITAGHLRRSVNMAGMIAQLNFVSNYRFTTCKVYSLRSSRIESAIGFEPMNISFAERPLKPLGYADIFRQSSSIS